MRQGQRGIRLAVALAAVALLAAGCGSFGKPQQPAAPVDPNTYPADYKAQIVVLLRQSLTDRADFRGGFVSAPALKPIGDSQRYVSCVQFHGRGVPKTKAAIFLEGKMTQFVDATPEQCSAAPYEPFRELEAALPPQ